MTESTPASVGYVIKPPRQARSAESWRRILKVGRELIEEGGTQALTLAALCQRAEVAPTTVYQRVDSMNGLIFAIFQERMAELEAANNQQIDEVLKFEAKSPERVKAAIAAVGFTFQTNEKFLKTITEYSVGDDNFWQNEDRSANHFVENITAALSFGDLEVASECTHYIFTENMVRIMFGMHWMGNTNESYPEFQGRVFRMVWARLNFESKKK